MYFLYQSLYNVSLDKKVHKKKKVQCVILIFFSYNYLNILLIARFFIFSLYKKNCPYKYSSSDRDITALGDANSDAIKSGTFYG
jgi:hypothetical protein